MSDAKKPYPVLDSLRHNGKKYFPDSENNIVELTALEAAPLLALAVIGESVGDNKPAAPEGEERVNLIKAAIAGLDKANADLFAKDGVTPKVGAIEAVTGWPVSAAERDEALKAAAE